MQRIRGSYSFSRLCHKRPIRVEGRLPLALVRRDRPSARIVFNGKKKMLRIADDHASTRA